jgi:hypothetical protein
MWRLAGSDAIELELSKMGNQYKLSKVLDLYSLRSSRLTVNERVKARSRELQRLGLRFFDSSRLVLPEIYKQDVLLTTDDAFIKTAARFEVAVPVNNPVVWLMEETRNES